ncbi:MULTISPECIES: hypothetical protein [unclassified Frankia]|uniref:hypothetical protein n=1 Tax=unclassified Frankia TaxID=2632575 RepID=UPI001EF4DC29|nr:MULTISPECIES: hypothetical protein [unclassified Frankia]
MSATTDETDLIRIVLADANVLYSRVLRDYLLYAADQEIIAITWSAAILTRAETVQDGAKLPRVRVDHLWQFRAWTWTVRTAAVAARQ